MGIVSTFKTCAVAAAMLAGSAVAGLAATFNGSFTIGGSAFSSPGLVVNTSQMSGSTSFNLNVGQSTTFDLFDIWTNDTVINGQDTTPQSITVGFSLSQPSTSGTVTGSSRGNSAFIFQWGSVDWQAPVMLAFGNGGMLSIALSNETFNFGILGLGAGQANGATVQATATYVSAPAPIPLPAAGFGLLAGLGALGMVRRRRSRIVA